MKTILTLLAVVLTTAPVFAQTQPPAPVPKTGAAWAADRATVTAMPPTIATPPSTTGAGTRAGGQQPQPQQSQQLVPQTTTITINGEEHQVPKTGPDGKQVLGPPQQQESEKESNEHRAWRAFPYTNQRTQRGQFQRALDMQDRKEAAAREARRYRQTLGTTACQRYPNLC